jgi:hypothetical protein
MGRMIYDYTKSTLEKVSVDPVRFEKELKKASKTLLEDELESLCKWLKYYTKKKADLKAFAKSFAKRYLIN